MRIRSLLGLIFAFVLASASANGQAVTIPNPSFETATLPFSGGNGPYSNQIAGSTLGPFGGTLSDWTATSTNTNAAAGGFAPTIGGINWTSKWWTGSNIAYLQTSAAGSVSLSQTLSDSLQNNTTYTLSVQVGRRSLGSSFSYSLQLWAGSTLLSSVGSLPLASNTSAMDRLVYNSGPSNPAAGQNLKIVLSSTWVSSSTEAFFDDVSLTAAPTSITTLVSSPSSSAQLGQTATLTATVSPSSATGRVTFFDGETMLGIATVAGGQASLSTSLQHSGQRSFRALYGGDSATGPSSSTSLPFTVNAAVVGIFAPAAPYTTLQGPLDLTSGDFNGDGKADLAVTDNSVNKVSILLGVGDGTFASHVDYDAGSGPVGIATGDFNGDGKTDLVISDISAASLRVLLGSGTGTFGSPVNLSVGSNPQGVAVGDFNLDGKADIVAANNGSSSVTVLIGNGDGSFQAGISYSSGSGPRGVAIGEFNGDGIPDLAVANNTAGTIGILRGNGNGSFQPATTFTAGSPFYLAIADLNGDGKQDLIASNLSSANIVSVLLGNGNGTFQTYQPYGTTPASTGARGLTVGDFSGDGKPDVVLANWQAAAVSILYNNGDGTLGNSRSVTVGQGPHDVIAGDFNGDGVPDIAAALFNGGSGSSVGVVLGAPPPPADLIPQNITLSASALQVGASLTVNWTLANIGTAAAGAPSTTTVRINQSTTSSAGTDLAGVATPALAAGTSVAQNITVAVPATPGTYYVWVVADRFSTANQNVLNDVQRSGPLVLTIEPPTLNMSHDLVALGIAGQNMAPNNPSLDSRPLFQAAINYVQSHAAVTTLTVDPGAYYLKTNTQSNAVLIFGRSNITMDLAGSTLYFNGPFVPNGLYTYYTNNITLKNFKIDFINPAYTHVQLTSVDTQARVLSYQTIPGWPNPSTFNGLVPPFGGQPLLWAVAFRNGKIVPGTTRMHVTGPVSGNTLTLTQDGTPWTQSAALSTLQAGDTIVFAVYGGGPPLLIWGGDNQLIQNVTIYGSPSAAIQMYATTNSTLDGARVMPRPGTGLIGSTLDGINFLQVRQNNHLRNSYVTGTLDDALTMNSQYAGTVVNKTGPRTLNITRGGYSDFPNGTLVNFVDIATSMESPGATIISQSPSFVTGFNESVQLTFDQDLPASLPAGTGMVYGLDTMRGLGSTIEDNLVEDTYGGRGVWVTGAVGLTISRNVIRRTSLSGIQVENDTGGFPAGPSRNITISDNALEGAVGPAAAGTGTQVALASVHVTSLTSSVNNQPFGLAASNANINAVNNYIADSGRSGMWIGELNGGTLQNNLVIRWNQYPNAELFGIPPAFAQQVTDDFAVPIVIRYSTGVVETGNTISGNSPITTPVTMTPSNLMVSGGGATGSFQLQTAVTGFGWKATSDAAWLTITSGPIGAGNASVQYSVAANSTGASRTAHITIAGEVFSITQDPLKKGRNQITSQ